MGANQGAAQVGVFDFENRTVLLNSGYTMPIMGLGTYALDHDTCVNSVLALIADSGRLIDTAKEFTITRPPSARNPGV